MASSNRPLPTQRRSDLRGYPLPEGVFVTKCAECGMGLVSGSEFHPYRACEVFKETHDSNRVWEVLAPLVDEVQRAR